MSNAERQAHDGAWGLDFGDPDTIDFVYEGPKQKKQNLWGRLFGAKPEPANDTGSSPLMEHPMSINMGDKLREQLKSSPVMLRARDERGWTWLHTEALAGNLTSIRIFIEAGADPNARTNDGATALDVAGILGWSHVIDYLRNIT